MFLFSDLNLSNFGIERVFCRIREQCAQEIPAADVSRRDVAGVVADASKAVGSEAGASRILK